MGAGYPAFAGGISPTQTPFLSGAASPFGANPFGGNPFGGNPFGANPYANQFANQFAGLSHTSPESIESYSRQSWADPYLAARVTQTFPYLQFALPPIVSLY
jgi:hypothetical protein